MKILSIIIPIFSIFAIGYVGQKFLNFKLQDLSKLTVYLMMPFLCFMTFYTHELSMADAYLFVFTMVLFFVLIGIVYIASYFLSYKGKETSALILSSILMNSGNYGTPIVFLAFGQAGRSVAILLMVFHGLFINTVGVYYAAKGGEDAFGTRSALRSVLRMPILYATMLGILFQVSGIDIPQNMLVCIQMVGDASIPTVMIILGMQLAMISLKRVNVLKMMTTISIKLVVSPIIAFVLVMWLPAEPVVKQIFILSAGMPTAANAALLAIQFRADPEFVASATFISTILSIPSIAFILYLIEYQII